MLAGVLRRRRVHLRTELRSLADAQAAGARGPCRSSLRAGPESSTWCNRTAPG
jgi:hypothetical protein